MKLLFDARWIRTDFHDGISRYTTELGNALAVLTPVTFLICDKAQLTLLPPDAKHIIIHPPDSIKELFTALILNRFKPDIVVSPMQTMGSVGRKFKLILTLHDLIYYKHRLPPPVAKGALLRLGWRLYHLSYAPQRFVLNHADIVATVSQTSRAEIVAAQLTKRPIIVVSNAARDLSNFLKKPIAQLSTPPKNLIFMGTLLPYKNAELLIQMMEFLPGRTLHLLSKVTPARKAELYRLIPQGAQIIFHGGVSDETYAQLLGNDAIMVSASKAEGFGLPLAEALQLGTPAVVSDLAFFHEVGGDGAVYADPADARNFAKAIVSIDDIKTRQALVKRGKAHIKTFSWNQSATILLDATKKI